METVDRGYFTGERALFKRKNLIIRHSVFDDGESPLKECENIELYESMFRWKYPLWCCRNIKVFSCALFEAARAGIWYTNDIVMRDCIVEAPKIFRRCHGVSLENVTFSDAAETMWSCHDVSMENVTVRGDYFAMNSENVAANKLEIIGNYCFDGAKNIEIRNSKLLSKDAFWNSENVTVRDSFISGEYLGWNSRNLTFENCTIESLQGMCYIENLKLINCRLINTTLAFEYSTVDVCVEGKIDSVKNPSGGTIVSDGIDEIIIEDDKVDVDKTRFICETLPKGSPDDEI